ncbi:MAG: hypothetical protein RR365_13025 [Bacteroides sp.]
MKNENESGAELKKTAEKLIKNIADLFKVRSLITVIMTVGLLGMIFRIEAVSPELLAIYSTTYGSVMTYFFTHPKSGT